MKRIALICTVVFCAVPALVFGGDSMVSESGWFDFENCAFCKSLTEDPDLLHHTTWENYPIKNGAMNIMTVEPAYAESMAKVDAHMAALGGKIQNGEVNPMSLEMCGRCKHFGMLMMGGVDMERVEGEAAIVTLMTSSDPAVTKKLQEMAERDTKEMALMHGGDKKAGGEHPSSEHPKSEHPNH